MILANAEFLTENNRTPSDRSELYQEVRWAVNEMTELIDSLLEFSRTREALHPTNGDLEGTIERAVRAVTAHPDFQRISVNLHREADTDGWFDARKMERVFQNLIRNALAYETFPSIGRVEVMTVRTTALPLAEATGVPLARGNSITNVVPADEVLSTRTAPP
jgi:signal transduction histidine kinase